MQIAILDDYQGIALALADWSPLADCGITVFRDHLQEEDAVAARLAPFEIVVAMRERTPFPAALVARLPNLKLLVTTGRRNAAIDVAACRARGIVVSGTEIGPPGTAELAFGLIIDLMRRITAEDRAVRAGKWQSGVGDGLAGRTLGLIGLGRLGSRMAKLAAAFDMRVIAWSQNLTAERATEAGAAHVDRDTLLKTADVVSLHLILSARTRGLIGRRELALMRPTAYLVNTSRGPIVDELALAEALRAGTIAGAGIDVYDEEPLPMDHPLRDAPNTVLTPHIGYVTRENLATMYAQSVESIRAWRNGAPIRLLD
jgi:phosphoglycerate dehydrogenase-like enzyme